MILELLVALSFSYKTQSFIMVANNPLCGIWRYLYVPHCRSFLAQPPLIVGRNYLLQAMVLLDLSGQLFKNLSRQLPWNFMVFHELYEFDHVALSQLSCAADELLVVVVELPHQGPLLSSVPGDTYDDNTDGEATAFNHQISSFLEVVDVAIT
jgi:hypothetical protein